MLQLQAQAKLIELGLLDPPADNIWGNFSALALQNFQKQNNLEPDARLNPQTKDALARAEAIPLRNGNTLAGRIAKHMESMGHFVARGKGLINIAYLEGVGADGKINDDRTNEWNDLRICFEIVSGEAIELGRWAATTEPGWYWIKNRRGNPKGAARIAFGQYKAWRVGMHLGKHEALVQRVNSVTVHRDFNCDGYRTGDKLDTGIFGINQHWGYDMANVDNASAGCLVGQSRIGHRHFMKIVKSDLRFQLDRDYLFYTAIYDGSKVLA